MKSNRREFLYTAGALSMGLSLFPTIIKASVLGRDGHIPPSDKINMILIGCGRRGRINMSNFLNFDDVRVVAVCDVDDNHLGLAKKMVDDAYGNTDCRVYKDFREVLEKEDADTAILALPDHYRNFIDCVKSRGKTIAPAEAGHRAISIAHLGEIAIKTGQKLFWDPQAERFTDGNIYATRLLNRPYRAPWTFPECIA